MSNNNNRRNRNRFNTTKINYVIRTNNNRRNARRNRILNRLPPEDSQRVQTLGAGALMSRITIPYNTNFTIQNAEDPTVNIISLGNLIESNPEFTDKQYNFKYYKIIGIKIIKFPNNNTSIFTHFIVYLDWGARNSNYTYEYMLHADTVKRIPFYNFKVLNYKFKPPNANLPTSNSQASYINLRNFNSTYDNFTIPINLCVVPVKQPNTNAQTAYVNFVIEVLIQYRGSEYYSNAAKLVKAIKYMKNEEIQKLKEALELRQNEENRKQIKNEIITSEEEEDKESNEENFKKIKDSEKNIENHKVIKRKIKHE